MGSNEKLAVEEDPKVVVFERLDNIKHTDEKGNITWSGRKLYKALDMPKWTEFKKLINECKKTIREAHSPADAKKLINEYFREVSVFINVNHSGISRSKEVDDFVISPYGAHLICCANIIIETTDKNYLVNQYALEYLKQYIK